jgi:hypothetical protein
MLFIEHFINKLPSNHSILEIYLFMLNNNFTLQKKFAIYKQVQENIFLKESHKHIFADIFFEIQKIYHSFKILHRLIFTTQVVDKDLNFNTITKNDKNVIKLIHNHKLFLFNIRDLIKIIENSLTNNDSMFSEPLGIKNPYDNDFFQKHNLYNIYFHIKFSSCYHSDLFHKFFLEDFCLKRFFQKYEYILREEIIKRFVFMNSDKIVLKEIMLMILDFNNIMKKSYLKYKINIHPEFPNNKLLLKVFKPYLYLYLESKFSLVPSIKKFNDGKFIFKMKQFSEENYKFSRKIINKIRVVSFEPQFNIDRTTISFNENYIKYNDDYTPNTTQVINYAYLALNNLLYENNYTSNSSQLISTNEQFNHNTIDNTFYNNEYDNTDDSTSDSTHDSTSDSTSDSTHDSTHDSTSDSIHDSIHDISNNNIIHNQLHDTESDSDNIPLNLYTHFNNVFIEDYESECEGSIS